MDLEQLENYPYHASKSAKNYLLRFVTSNILGAVVKKSSPPNKVMYNDHTGIDRLHECFLGKNHVNCLILTYRQAFSRARGSNTVETIKSGTKSNFCSFFFVAMRGLFLSSRMKMYNKIKSKYHRPFQVIPQLKMKIRPVTFGVQQTAELMMRMVKKKVDVSKFVPEQSLVPEPSVIKMKLLEKTIRECEAEKSKLEQQLQSDDGVNDSKKRKRTEKLEKVNEQIRKKQKQSDDRLRIDTTKKKSTKKTKKTK